MTECAGCGARAWRHPMVGIGRGSDDQLQIFSVCERCWAVPNNRNCVLDMVFFPRDQAERALAAAISTDEASKRGDAVLGVGSR